MPALWTVLAVVAGQVGYLASGQAGEAAPQSSALTASEGREPEFGIAPNLTRVQAGVTSTTLTLIWTMLPLMGSYFDVVTRYS